VKSAAASCTTTKSTRAQEQLQQRPASPEQTLRQLYEDGACELPERKKKARLGALEVSPHSRGHRAARGARTKEFTRDLQWRPHMAELKRYSPLNHQAETRPLRNSKLAEARKDQVEAGRTGISPSVADSSQEWALRRTRQHIGNGHPRVRAADSRRTGSPLLTDLKQRLN